MWQRLHKLLVRLGLLLPGKVHYIGGSDTLPPPLPREEETLLLERLAGQEGWVLLGAACGAAAVALAARRAAQSADSGSSRCMAETS